MWKYCPKKNNNVETCSPKKLTMWKMDMHNSFMQENNLFRILIYDFRSSCLWKFIHARCFIIGSGSSPELVFT